VIRFWISTSLALLFIVGICKSEPTPESYTEDERIVREMEVEASKAIAEKDVGRLLSRYADSPAVYYADGPAMIGKEG
jgi:hypothetical protein